MTKRFSKTARPRREPTLELVEWTGACQEYCDARLAGQVAARYNCGPHQNSFPCVPGDVSLAECHCDHESLRWLRSSAAPERPPLSQIR